ncbi:single-stranded DNA-binding protein [Colwellia sp. BRX9-1]|uniref:single-stranded DNA-binding protein n=1 Tax=Colwellia sp. BRX9-1 TaxID=2759830 RepID=UPI0015F3B27C|nr:single-stranded DNA-binding protein [Colwellia sp. BRX9-1]MBA6352550.1 single-stranded DNA-binding protein [Colwellia sp. BRX9-1]
MTNHLSQNHLCSVTLLGNLVAKPDIRYQANPVVAVAELVLATHSRWFDKTSQQFKEWTSYHTVKVIGDIVDRSLIHSQKGDVILVQGYLLNSKKANREILHATYAQTFAKGYAQSINQVHMSGEISSDINLVLTENNKELVALNLTVNNLVYSPITQQTQNISIERSVHIWGKQAHYIKDKAELGDQLVVDGRLSYLNDSKKSQFIDSHQVILLKH